MSFTKVAPAGIGTEPGSEIRIGDSLLHSTGLDIGTGSGIGVTIRQHGDATFTGIITASAFFGDGSGLEGVSSSGIGTALNDDDTNVLNKIYYVNQELSIGSTVTVNHPDTGTASYTHYQDLVVKDDADFIVADGDTFIPDILGITTSTLAASAATGGRIRAGTLTNAGANGAPNFPNGVTGTSATFTTGTITGNLNVGGVLTYEDVTNVDSVGVITARSGIKIGATGANTLISGTGTGIGIGTANPTDVLDINSEQASAVSDVFIRNHANLGGAALNIWTQGTYSSPTYKAIIGCSDAGGTIRVGAVSNHPLLLLTNNTERLRIDSSGNVTKPNHPCFRAGCSSDLNPGGNGTIIFQDVTTTGSHFNVGGHYSTTTGAFTAPVAGVYNFYTQILWESMNNGEDMHDAIYVMYNSSGGGTGGSLVSYDARRAEYVAGTTGNSGYYGAFTTVMVNMVAGGSVYVRNKNNLTVHGNRNFTFFQGYLIG